MRASRFSAAAVGALFVVGAVFLAAGPAAAHDYAVSTTPAEGSTVTELPAEFSVTMSAPILDLAGDGTGSGIQVTDAAGLYYGDGCTTISDATVSMPATLGDAGEYRVVWQVVSSDSHPTSGEFTFVWEPGAGVTGSAGSSAPPVCGEAVEEEPPVVTETPTPEPTQATETPNVTDDADPGGFDVLLWVGIGLAAIALTVGSILIALRARRT